MAKMGDFNFEEAAAQRIRDKVAAKTSKKTTGTSTKSTSKTSSDSSSIAARPVMNVAVPGLKTILPDSVAGMMPTYDMANYQITDPLNPPSEAPQATQAQFDKGMGIYEGMQRALKLTGASFDTTAENFRTFGKYAKAYGAGIQAVTEVEKVKGNYLDYLNQTEQTQQKAIGLGNAQYKTDIVTHIAVHTNVELDEKLVQARLKAETSQATTQKSQGQLNALKASLGEYLPQSK